MLAQAYIVGTGLPLNKLQAEHFPLPTLSARIRKLSIKLPENQPYFIIRGLKPQWFTKVKNIILYMGIASHVATKRAMAAGDPVVLRMSNAIDGPSPEKQSIWKLTPETDHITNIPIPSEQDGTSIYRGPANRAIALVCYTLAIPQSKL